MTTKEDVRAKVTAASKTPFKTALSFPGRDGACVRAALKSGAFNRSTCNVFVEGDAKELPAVERLATELAFHRKPVIHAGKFEHMGVEKLMDALVGRRLEYINLDACGNITESMARALRTLASYDLVAQDARVAVTTCSPWRNHSFGHVFSKFAPSAPAVMRKELMGKLDFSYWDTQHRLNQEWKLSNEQRFYLGALLFSACLWRYDLELTGSWSYDDSYPMFAYLFQVKGISTPKLAKAKKRMLDDTFTRHTLFVELDRNLGRERESFRAGDFESVEAYLTRVGTLCYEAGLYEQAAPAKLKLLRVAK